MNCWRHSEVSSHPDEPQRTTSSEGRGEDPPTPPDAIPTLLMPMRSPAANQDWRWFGGGFAILLVILLATVDFTGSLVTVDRTELLERSETYVQLVGFDGLPSTLTGTGVAVCIVDSGIDLTHPDLASVSLSGWTDLVNEDTEPYDDDGHGTAMAGLLVANGVLQGLTKDIDLHVAKALSGEGDGEDADVASAIDWCRGRNVDVISLSLGGAPGFLGGLTGTASGNAADEAIDQGIIVVAAAGNDGDDPDDEDVSQPGGEPDVICVGGIDEFGRIWSGSSRGDNDASLFPPRFPRSDPDRKPELVAPAVRVPVLSEGGHAFVNGTSAATVYVTGAMVAVHQFAPDVVRDERSFVEDVKQAILESSKGQSSHDERYGYGALDVGALIANLTAT